MILELEGIFVVIFQKTELFATSKEEIKELRSKFDQLVQSSTSLRQKFATQG